MLSHNLVRNKLVDLIENTFRREEVFYLACNEERAFSLPKNIKNSIYGFVKSDRCTYISYGQYLY